jgi:hypothetical protein
MTTTEIWAAVLLIAAPLWFNATFALLEKRFDYPDILRDPRPRSSNGSEPVARR